MSYIGTTPKDTFTTGLVDRFTSTTGTTVTLTHEISSKNDIIVFVNFVKQDSTNYSVGGTGNKTLTLGGTLVSSDIVEVHYLNKVFATQQPSANSVGITELNLSEGTSGQALTTNGSGTLSFSTISAGITEADSWRITSSFTATTGSTQVLTSNWERDDTYQNGNLGTGMSESSGIFTFPSTGFYLLSYHLNSNSSAGSSYLTNAIQLTTNNSSYNSVNEGNSHIAGVAANYVSQTCEKIFDITDTSNQKVRFTYDSSHALTIRGSTSGNTTYVSFIRLGDT
tara:strand:+ start:30 stop:875 length:846 start_codon:yes stop_codon:yes gene_type:complete